MPVKPHSVTNLGAAYSPAECVPDPEMSAASGTMHGVLLSELVRTSDAVSLASGRRVKIDEIAGLLRRVSPGEVPVAVAFLSG
jgi:hypothetical protein